MLHQIAQVRTLLQRRVLWSKIRVRHYSRDGLKHLLQRGIIQEFIPPANEEVFNLFTSKQCVYCGFDPTADSLHVGNLLAIVLMLHMQRMGHEVVAVIGDCTARVGDPSGRPTERDEMDGAVVEKNVRGLRDNLETVFLNHEEHFWSKKRRLEPLRIVRNSEWYDGQGVVPFLATVGRYFRVGKMMSRTSVQQRLNSGEGISLAEFTYQVFQSFDWLYLYDKYNCRFQIGGGDQLGNIDSGHDLVKRTRTKDVYGILAPLVTTETGDKYGKTAGNAVWLSAEKTTPYDFYQFFLRLSDREAIKFLKLFTFAEQKELDDLIEEQMRYPEKRKAQKRLAKDLTLLVHGEGGLRLAKTASEVLFGSNPTEALHSLDQKDLRLIFGDSAYVRLQMRPGMDVLAMAMEAKLFPTKEDALRIINAGGLYVNQSRVAAPSHVLVRGVHVLPSNMTLARVGKKNYCLIQWLT